MPANTSFFGRSQELEMLSSLFQEAARKQENGNFGGPRAMCVISESGLGKSRLVQELYHQLAKDPSWNAKGYWPARFSAHGTQLCVAPDMRQHEPEGPPEFIWLGWRWKPTDERNVHARQSILPELRRGIAIHKEIHEKHSSVWKVAWQRVEQNLSLDEILTEGTSELLQLVGLPSIFKLPNAVVGGVKFIIQRNRQSTVPESVEAELERKELEETLQDIILLMDRRDALPMVLWLDDAHWIDPLSLSFIEKLWMLAKEGNWPLFIIATHWEREWLQQRADPASIKGLANLTPFATDEACHTLHLNRLADSDFRGYLQSTLPGLPPHQQDLLIGKAAGNFLTMVENVGELVSEPGWFEDEDIQGPLTTDAETHIETFESERHLRITQRFKALSKVSKTILGWSAQMGPRFLSDHLVNYAIDSQIFENEPRDAIRQCVDPLAVLENVTQNLHEFRDSIYYQNALKYLQTFRKADVEKIRAFLTGAVIQWGHGWFDTVSLQTGHPPPDTEQQENLLMADLALTLLHLDAEGDFQTPDQQGALRAYVAALHIYKETGDRLQARRCAETLAALSWPDIPITVVSTAERLRLLSALSWTGALSATHPLLLNTIEHYQRLAHGRSEAADAQEQSESLTLARLSDALQIQAKQSEQEGNLELACECLQGAVFVWEHLEDARLTTFAQLPKQNSKHTIAEDAVIGFELSLPTIRLNLANTLDRLGTCELRLQNPTAASRYLERSTALLRGLIAEQPAVQAQASLAKVLGHLGWAEYLADNKAEAHAHFSESLQLHEALYLHPANCDDALLFHYSDALNSLAQYEEQQGALDSALPYAEKALQVAEELATQTRSAADWHRAYDGRLQPYLRLQYRAGNAQALPELIEQYLDTATRLSTEFPNDGFSTYIEILQELLAESDG